MPYSSLLKVWHDLPIAKLWRSRFSQEGSRDLQDLQGLVRPGDGFVVGVLKYEVAEFNRRTLRSRLSP